MGDSTSSGSGKGRGPGSRRPGKGRAVSSTARAGCGRGRDGRVCGERGGILAGGSRGSDERDTDPSRKSDLVTEMPGTSPFLPSSSDVAPVSSQFSPLCGGNCELILPGGSLPGRTVTEGRPS